MQELLQQEEKREDSEGKHIIEVTNKHYQQAYDHLTTVRKAYEGKIVEVAHNTGIEHDKVALQIYQLLLKRKPIFKVEECKRRRRTRDRLKRKLKETTDSIKKEEFEAEVAVKVAEEYLYEKVELQKTEI